MESDRYAWTVGWVRSEFNYLDADVAFEAAKKWSEDHYNAGKNDIRVYRRLIEEVIPLGASM